MKIKISKEQAEVMFHALLYTQLEVDKVQVGGIAYALARNPLEITDEQADIIINILSAESDRVRKTNGTNYGPFTLAEVDNLIVSIRKRKKE
jgi:hypothetical protein